MEILGGNEVNRYSNETMLLLRELAEDWETELPPGPDGEFVRVRVINVSFEALKDPEERRFFNAVPTTFSLEPETVDRIRAAARTLLRQDPDFRALVHDLR